MAFKGQVSVDEDEKQRIVTVCREFLGRGWDGVDFDDIVCRRISSGVANKTYYCSIEECKSMVNYGDIKHKDVIVHITGNLFEDKSILKFNGLESVICQELYRYRMAPKLLGSFPEGRIEEYIPSRTATVEDLKSPDICKAVMRKIAKFHSLELPISKHPNLLQRVAQIYRNTFVSKDEMDGFTPEKRKAYLSILEFPFEEEYAWITRNLSSIGYKLVCSHNDMNPNNILIKDNTPLDDAILLIDYELCTYFYRAYDIAYFFRKKNLRFGMDGKRIVIQRENNENIHRDELLKEYLKEELKLNPKQFNPNYDNVDRLSMEVDFCELVYDIFSIGLRKSLIRDTSLILNWDLMTNFVLYEERKKAFLQKYGDKLNAN